MSSKAKVVKLKDVCTINAGRSLRGHIHKADGTGVGLVQMRDMGGHSIDWNDCTSIELTGKAKPRFIEHGDTLLQTKGVNNEVAFVDASINEAENSLVTAPYIFILRPHADNKDILPEYLTWWLAQEPTQKYFKKQATGEKSVSLTRPVVEHTAVVIPSIKKQKEIIKAHHEAIAAKKELEQLIIDQQAAATAIAISLLEQ